MYIDGFKPFTNHYIFNDSPFLKNLYENISKSINFLVCTKEDKVHQRKLLP